MPVRSYRDLEVWQKAMDLAAESNRVADRLPAHEKYRLATQLRRAAFSVPANIAEGNSRLHRREYIHHVSVARGSLAELETGVALVLRSSYLDASEIAAATELASRVGKMLTRLSISLRAPRKE